MQPAITISQLDVSVDASGVQLLVYDATAHAVLTAQGSTVTLYPLAALATPQVRAPARLPAAAMVVLSRALRRPGLLHVAPVLGPPLCLP